MVLCVGLTGYSYFFHELNLVPTLGFIVLTVLAHLSIDSVTSKINAYFFTQKQMTLFWWSIGFDQFLHTGLLVLTTPLLLR